MYSTEFLETFVLIMFEHVARAATTFLSSSTLVAWINCSLMSSLHIFANYYKDNLGQFKMFCFRDMYSRMALSELKCVVVGDERVGEL